MLFKDVVGQQSVKQKLIHEVQQDHVSHACMFLGNMGHGGLPLTLAFIQYLMCSDRTKEDSCGKCSSCQKVEKLAHPDLHFSFPTTQAIAKTSDPLFSTWKEAVLENPYLSLNEWIQIADDKGRKPIISVHQSEEIIKKLTLKSFEGGYKISVIWMAEAMNVSCANKLLKIIEEPPKDTIFILVVGAEETVLPTILSRTQITKINPLSDEDISTYLKQKTGQNSDLLKSITSRAEGSLSHALEMINEASEEQLNQSLFIELMRVCYQKKVLKMMDWSERISKLGREEQKQFIKYALYMIRQSLMQNYTDGQLMRTSTEEAQFLNKFAQFITGNNVLDFQNLFNEAHFSVERNAHSQLLFTNVTFEVMRYIHRA